MRNNILQALPFMAAIFVVGVHGADAEAEPPTAEKGVPMIVLNNGKKMPQLGFGTFTLKGETATQAVTEALRQGYRLIDTAQGYGNEADVWKGVEASGVPRKEVFITTKIDTSAMREGKVRESIERSLKNLGGEYIDLMLVHWPVKGKIKETWRIMEEYVRAGKLRSIGLSNFNPHHMDDVMSWAEIKPVVNQIEIHPYMTQYGVAAHAKNLGIQVESWGPLGQGDQRRPFRSDACENRGKTRKVRRSGHFALARAARQRGHSAFDQSRAYCGKHRHFRLLPRRCGNEDDRRAEPERENQSQERSGRFPVVGAFERFSKAQEPPHPRRRFFLFA